MLKNDVLRFIIAYKVDKLMCNLSKGIENKGVAKGIGIGETNKAKDMAINLNDMGVDIEVIAKSANVSVDQVKEWLAKK